MEGVISKDFSVSITEMQNQAIGSGIGIKESPKKQMWPDFLCRKYDGLLLDLMNKYSTIEEYKINVQKLIVFLYTSKASQVAQW